MHQALSMCLTAKQLQLLMPTNPFGRGGVCRTLREAETRVHGPPGLLASDVLHEEGDAPERPVGLVCSACAFTREIESRVRALSFARGYHPEFLGEYAEQQRSRRRLLWLSVLSILAMVVILHADFRSFRLTTLVFLSLPFALVGGVLAVLASGGIVSLGSLVGFVTVLGIAGRNGIMLISHYRHLQSEEGLAFGPELVLRGSEERLAPILMTALTTVLALVPIVLGGNRPGQEIEHPMALVIVGGLVTSTLLNLFLIPALYVRFGAGARPGD